VRLGKQEYEGIWSSPGGVKRKMQIKDKNGQTVRCADCYKRKKCSHIRVNKYARKPCKDYMADLYKESNKIRERQKSKEAETAFKKARQPGFRMDRVKYQLENMKDAPQTKLIDKARSVGMSHQFADEATKQQE